MISIGYKTGIFFYKIYFEPVNPRLAAYYCFCIPTNNLIPPYFRPPIGSDMKNLNDYGYTKYDSAIKTYS